MLPKRFQILTEGIFRLFHVYLYVLPPRSLYSYGVRVVIDFWQGQASEDILFRMYVESTLLKCVIRWGWAGPRGDGFVIFVKLYFCWQRIFGVEPLLQGLSVFFLQQDHTSGAHLQKGCCLQVNSHRVAVGQVKPGVLGHVLQAWRFWRPLYCGGGGEQGTVCLKNFVTPYSGAPSAWLDRSINPRCSFPLQLDTSAVHGYLHRVGRAGTTRCR